MPVSSSYIVFFSSSSFSIIILMQRKDTLAYLGTFTHAWCYECFGPFFFLFFALRFMIAKALPSTFGIYVVLPNVSAFLSPVFGMRFVALGLECEGRKIRYS